MPFERKDQKLEFLLEYLLSDYIVEEHPEFTELIKLYLKYLDENYYQYIINWLDNTNYLEIFEKFELPTYLRGTDDGGNRVTDAIRNRQLNLPVQPEDEIYGKSDLVHYYFNNYFNSVIPEEKIFPSNDKKRLYIILSKLINNFKGNEKSFYSLFQLLGDVKLVDDAGEVAFLSDLELVLSQNEDYWNISPTLNRYDFPFTYNYTLTSGQGVNSLVELLLRIHPSGYSFNLSTPIFPASGNPTVAAQTTVTSNHNATVPFIYSGIYKFGGVFDGRTTTWAASGVISNTNYRVQ